MVHVEQAVSLFDEKYKVVPQEKFLYRSEICKSGSLGPQQPSQRSQTWHQRPGQPVWITGLELDPSQWVRVGSRPSRRR